MPKEIVVHAWCDACYLEDDRTPGAVARVALGSAKAREVILCDGHREALLDPLAALVKKAGTPVEENVRPATQKAPRPPAGQGVDQAGDPVLEFPVDPADVVDLDQAARTCPKCGATSKSVLGLVQHAKTHHDLSVRGLWGGQCPICGLESGLLGAHAKTHGVDDVPTLFALAQHEGDPVGVIAGRQEQEWGVAA